MDLLSFHFPAGDVLRRFLVEHIALAVQAHTGKQKFPFKGAKIRKNLLQIRILFLELPEAFHFFLSDAQLDLRAADGAVTGNTARI